MNQVSLPVRTVSEMNVRTHWAKRAARMREHRKIAYLMVPRVSLPCVVTLRRVSAGELDDDNVRSALKGVRDGIADRLGVKDNDPRVEWVYEQEKGPRGSYSVNVRIVTVVTSADEALAAVGLGTN